MRKILLVVIIIASTILKVFPQTKRVKILRHKLHMASLLQRKDFNSEMKWNIQYAEYLGVKVGKNCRFFGGIKYSTEPYLIEIGDNVIISGTVSFMTHDGGVLMCHDEDNNILGHFGKIKIGNGCFIGNSAIILPNVEIGDNCLIAAGSVVINSFPPNSVIMGNPAKLAFKLSTYKKMKLYSKNTVRHDKYSYPHEEEIPRQMKKEILLQHFKDLPIGRTKRKKCE